MHNIQILRVASNTYLKNIAVVNKHTCDLHESYLWQEFSVDLGIPSGKEDGKLYPEA